MILYISDTLGSSRNGGVSLSGVDFLQLLRLHYDGVAVLASDTLPRSAKSATTYGNMPTRPLGKLWRLAGKYHPRSTLRSIVRFALVQLKNIGATKRLSLSGFYDKEQQNMIFVNSWSSLYPSSRILGDHKFRKVCVVRGNPESFVWQSKGTDKSAEIEDAAKYLRLFDDLIFVSKIGLDRWRPFLSDKTRCYYLPNSVDDASTTEIRAEDLDNLKASLGFAENKTHLVAVGSVQIRKGQDILIDTALRLRELGYQHFLIHVVGVISEPWGGKAIVSQIKNSPMGAHFRFYGHRNDALKYARAADICLFPSRAEAFPRTIAEYMALEKPIVSTDVSGVPEMIRNGENGLLCGIEEGKQLGEKVASLIENPDLAQRLAQDARRTYETSFSKIAQAKRACDIFGKLDRRIDT